MIKKPAKNNGGVTNRALSVKRTYIWTGAGRHSGVWWMETGIWNGVAYSLWLWGIGCIKIQTPSSALYETGWLWWHLYHQCTALCSKHRAAECVTQNETQRIENGFKCMGQLWCPPLCFIFWLKVLFMFNLNRTNINHYMKMILKLLLYSVLHLNTVPFVILLSMCLVAFV